LHQHSLLAKNTKSTVRVLSSSASRVQSEDDSARRWALGVAGLTGVLGGTLSLALCDQPKAEERKPQFNKRRVTKGVMDPMTSYELYAMKRQESGRGKEEVKEEKVKPQEKVERADDASLQATSAVVDATIAPTETMTQAEKSLEESARKAKQHSGGLKLFSGNGNMSLALDIARHLGINLGKATVGRFADGEVNCVIQENVRGKDVYILQPTCPPVNDNIMELLLMVSTLRRASARRITVVIPYYGYARQDRKMQVRS